MELRIYKSLCAVLSFCFLYQWSHNHGWAFWSAVCCFLAAGHALTLAVRLLAYYRQLGRPVVLVRKRRRPVPPPLPTAPAPWWHNPTDAAAPSL